MKLKVGLELLGNIVNNGLVFLTERQARELYANHHEVIEELKEAQNKVFPEYTDIDLQLAEEKYENFLIAYGAALKASQNQRAVTGGE